jgi:hypothetical protein
MRAEIKQARGNLVLEQQQGEKCSFVSAFLWLLIMIKLGEESDDITFQQFASSTL